MCTVPTSSTWHTILCTADSNDAPCRHHPPAMLSVSDGGCCFVPLSTKGQNGRTTAYRTNVRKRAHSQTNTHKHRPQSRSNSSEKCCNSHGRQSKLMRALFERTKTNLALASRSKLLICPASTNSTAYIPRVPVLVERTSQFSHDVVQVSQVCKSNDRTNSPQTTC